MNVTVRLPPMLHRYAAAQTALRLELPATVGAALAALVERYPETRERLLDGSGDLFAHWALVRNGAALAPGAARGAVSLRDGDVLEVHAAAAGG